MRVHAMLALVGLAAVAHVQAQSFAPDPQRFEVISVKRSVSNITGHNDIQGNAYVGEGVTVASLIALANDPLPGSQILGGADWIKTERFDIRATFVGNPTRAQIQAMLRDALAQRFKLQTHLESRPMRVLQLVTSGSQLGPSLRRSSLDCGHAVDVAATADVTSLCMFHYNNGHVEGRGITIDQLAAKLIADRTVVNRTGLTGAFDVDLQWTPASVQTPSDAAPPSLVTALREQLGLRLESGTTAAAFLVIDHVEQPTHD